MVAMLVAMDSSPWKKILGVCLNVHAVYVTKQTCLHDAILCACVTRTCSPRLGQSTQQRKGKLMLKGKCVLKTVA